MPKNYETAQVYIDGVAARKKFKVASRQSLWTQFNSWAKKQGGVVIDGNQYLGMMAWKIPKGIAEVRIVSVTTDRKTHVY